MPKYYLTTWKQIAQKSLFSIMMHKILRGQFQTIFQEFTGDESITSFRKTKEMNH